MSRFSERLRVVPQIPEMSIRTAVDNLCIYDPEFEAYARRFADDLGGSTAICPVGTIAELKAAFDGYVMVSFLEIVIHGKGAGVLELADGTVVMAGFLGKLAMNTPFLKSRARVLFSSCGIGAGPTGTRFLDDLGKSMFVGKGGIVGASTVDNLVTLPNSRNFSQVFLKPFSDGRLRVRQYDTDGNTINETAVDRWGRTQ